MGSEPMQGAARSLAAGTRLGVYEIVGPIGAGGMGTVYRARDTRLPRDAAIKVSAEKFTDRFTREANVIASLNHPNITTLYDIGPDYLVMELVEGPTLADRIRQGPLSLDEASRIARQIADALDYAHEHGIVHRDLKPGNVKIRPDGVVKVLDFGLAKAGAVAAASGRDDSPTMTMPRTAAGVIIGTAAYMAPEQVKGVEVDKRADIWAFGCVFYEMLTGRSVYYGDTSQETMASILRDEPDLAKVSARARRLLRQCLEKDPQKRLRHIGDVMLLLDEPLTAEFPAPAVTSSAPVAPAANRKWLLPAVAAGVVIVIGAAVIALRPPWRLQTQPAVQAVRFEVGESDKMKFFYGGAMAVSPDGHWMVFPARGDDGVNRYWVRSLDTVEARPLPGTETAYVPPAWTWDSRQVIFTVLSNNKLHKVDIQGGPSQPLTDLPTGSLNGAASSKEGVIVFAVSTTGQPLFRVPQVGGPPVPITALAKGETGHRWPQFLPDGRHFLYQRVSSDPMQMGIYVGSIDAQPDAQSTTRLLATNREAYYAAAPGTASGYLVFLREATLMAQPFDPARLALSGEAVPVAEGVDSNALATYGLFSVSDSGTIVYRLGLGSNFVPTWFDEHGKPAGTLGEPGEFANPAVSPDGTRIAVARGPAGARDIWIMDVTRGAPTRLTFDSADDDNPVWSPDGNMIAFSSTRSGSPKVYVKPADGSSEERLASDHAGTPTSWSNGNRFLLFTSTGPQTALDVWAMPDPTRGSDVKPISVIATRFNEQTGQLSPDGRWIAYSSNESSVPNVYVRPFSPDAGSGAGGAKSLVSTGFALFPRWRADGKQLFYIARTTLDVMAVDVDTTNGLQTGTPKRLFTAPPPMLPVQWSLSADAKRFLFITTPDGGRMAPFMVVVNWAAALKK